MYKKFFIVTALVLTLAAGLTAAVAQGAGPHRHHHNSGWMLHRMTRELNLTDAQKTQIKGILQAQKAKTQPLREQLRQARLSQNSSTAGTFDEAQARAFANQQAQIMSNLIVERERTKSQIFAVLTPDQRQKAQQLMQEHRQRGRHGAPQTSQPQAQQSPS